MLGVSGLENVSVQEIDRVGINNIKILTYRVRIETGGDKHRGYVFS